MEFPCFKRYNFDNETAVILLFKEDKPSAIVVASTNRSLTWQVGQELEGISADSSLFRDSSYDEAMELEGVG